MWLVLDLSYIRPSTISSEVGAEGCNLKRTRRTRLPPPLPQPWKGLIPSCSWTCPRVGQLDTLTWACYYNLHFKTFYVQLYPIAHFSLASCFSFKRPALLEKLFFVLSVTYLCVIYHFIASLRAVVVVFSPPAPSCSAVWIELHLCTAVFFLKNNRLHYWRGKGCLFVLCVFFYCLCFSICHFVLLENQERNLNMWLIKK